MTSNGQIYQFESMKRNVHTTKNIHQLIEELKKEKELTYLQYRLSLESGSDMYLFGKYETLRKVLEELTKITYNYQKFTT